MGHGYEAPITSVELDQAERRLDAEIDQPEGDILAGLGFALLIALLAIGVAIATGAGYEFFKESAHASVTAKLEADASARKAIRPEQLSHPLGPCDLTLKEMVGPVVLREECYRRPK